MILLVQAHHLGGHLFSEVVDVHVQALYVNQSFKRYPLILRQRHQARQLLVPRRPQAERFRMTLG
jgi:hypothetical protein